MRAADEWRGRRGEGGLSAGRPGWRVERARGEGGLAAGRLALTCMLVEGHNALREFVSRLLCDERRQADRLTRLAPRRAARRPACRL